MSSTKSPSCAASAGADALDRIGRRRRRVAAQRLRHRGGHLVEAARLGQAAPQGRRATAAAALAWPGAGAPGRVLPTPGGLVTVTRRYVGEEVEEVREVGGAPDEGVAEADRQARVPEPG